MRRLPQGARDEPPTRPNPEGTGPQGDGASAAGRPSRERPARLDATATACLAATLVVSGHLLLRALALAQGGAGDDSCRAVFGAGCDATLTDPFSTQGGIPLAGWGVVGTACVLLLLALGRVLGDEFRARAHAATAVLLAVGAAVSAALVGMLAAGRFPLCPLCLVANGTNLLATAAWFSARARRGEIRDLGRRVGRGVRWLLGARATDAAQARWSAVAFACVALAGLALHQAIRAQAVRAEAAERPLDPAALVAAYDRAPVVEIDVGPDDPRLGPATAPARLVVWSDAFCPFCRSFWDRAADAVARHEPRAQVVFKHFPLDASCNRDAPASVHPGACTAALALEGARLQDAFWAYAAAVAATPAVRSRPDGHALLARDLGLDVERFRADAAGDAARARVLRDVTEGSRLRLGATPAVFLNGRRVEDLRPRALEVLLAHVLARETTARGSDARLEGAAR